ncbi:glycosyltransferase [Clostridium folliculivorans]|uniref:Glycosyl transferase n=1 Tax=Clostridium folliculivorans TaxID=2886038 RepID=A0A9W6DA75_9CLOT|nr:glycosyltransferase [Clostridium folliculivorans]GKU25080.1 glycosyl transferase [Clostridium folliculivorans]GKU31178.1 glycosyl transferase [Clostridium folliculivorans]
MKIFLFKGSLKIVEKSGVGKAIHHQQKAMEENNIAYTSNKKDYYDVMQLNTIFPDSVVAAIVAKMKGKKVIYYGHSTMEDFKNSFKGSDFFAPLFKKWIMFCYSLGDVIITPTEYSKKLLSGYGIKKPIFALSNGVDLSYFSPSPDGVKRFREKYKLKPNEKVVISVGHYIERKGISDFIKLAKRMPDIKFIWFGYTNLKLVPSYIQKAIAEAPKNVIFPGYISADELRDAYSGSDLFLFLTHEETEGIVLLEALAMKIAVLVRDIPIYSDDFSDGKEIYKASTLDEFQDKIEKIIDGSLPSLKDAAYELVKKKDIKAIGNRLQNIYNSIDKSYEGLDLEL